MTAFRPLSTFSLRRTGAILATIAGLGLSGTVHATDYVFNVLYAGDGNATLATSGSDNPDGTTLFDGDTFLWTITLTDDRYWEVIAGNDSFFPLMAFAVNEPGLRTGDYTLTLYNDLTEVFSETAFGEPTSQVHLGTNGITLDTGLVFDEMHLSFTLLSAVDLGDPASPSLTTINGLLPVFGAPEQNTYSPGIVLAPVPEPDARLMAAAGLLLLGAASRRVRRG